MDLSWKRTLAYCYFLFMIGFLIIYAVEFSETLDLDKPNEQEETEITAAQLIEEKDVEIILSTPKYNTIFDYDKYLSGTSAVDCFYSDENSVTIKDTIESIITNYKTNLESGAYIYYGFSSTMDFVDFFNDAINELSYYEVESIDDIYMYYSYIYAYNNYFNEVINVNDFNDIYVKKYYGDTVDSYLNMKGYHLLICKKNGASIIQTSEYTAEEKEMAQELYDKLIAITKLITEDEATGTGKKDFFEKMASLFDNGNFASPSIELNEYLQLNSTSASEFEEYFLAGLTVITEDLTISEGQMVSEFEAGCREIFSSQMDALVQNIKVEEETIHEEAIITSYGYHLYVNESSSLEDLFVDGKVICVPSIVHFALFIDEYNNSSYTDYVTPAGNLSGYLKADGEGNNDDKQSWLEQILALAKDLNIKEFENLTIDTVESEFIEKYLKSYTNYEKFIATESFNYDALAHNDNIYAGNYYFYAQVFSVYASSYNFDYIRYSYMLENIDSLNLGDRKNDVTTLLASKIASNKANLKLITDSVSEYKYGLFEKLNKEIYDEVMEYFQTISNK